MEHQSYYLIGVGFFSVFIHCLFKLNSLLKYAQAAKVDFDWKKDYLHKDYLSITISFCLVFLWYLLYTELSTNYEKIDKWKVTSFVGVAWFGSYIAQQIMSKGKKIIRERAEQIVDAINQNP